MVVVCPYNSHRTEWRRAMVLKRLNVTDFNIFFIDHGVFATVSYQMLRKLFKPFGVVPIQSTEAKLAGLQSFSEISWTPKEKSCFKRLVKKAKKNFMLGMLTGEHEVRVEILFLSASVAERFK